MLDESHAANTLADLMNTEKPTTTDKDVVEFRAHL